MVFGAGNKVETKTSTEGAFVLGAVVWSVNFLRILLRSLVESLVLKRLYSLESEFLLRKTTGHQTLHILFLFIYIVSFCIFSIKYNIKTKVTSFT